MTIILKKLRQFLLLGFLYFALVFVFVALGAQLLMIGLHVAGQEQTIRNFVNWFDWKFDGRFKNVPGNIYFDQDKTVAVGVISNKVQIGSLAGNRNLEFGIKNILEEVVQDKGYELDPAGKNVIDIDIVYLDVLKTESSFSVLHKNKESVVIRLQGRLYKDGAKKPVKKVLVEESADEVSMSTLAIDQGGKFNQQNLSSALKKTTVSLVNKLLD